MIFEISRKASSLRSPLIVKTKLLSAVIPKPASDKILFEVPDFVPDAICTLQSVFLAILTIAAHSRKPSVFLATKINETVPVEVPIFGLTAGVSSDSMTRLLFLFLMTLYANFIFNNSHKKFFCCDFAAFVNFPVNVRNFIIKFPD